MTLVIDRKSLSRILRWTQFALVASAATMLAYSGFVLLDAWLFQRVESRQLDDLLQAIPAASAGPRTVTPVPVRGLIGRITIARLGVSEIVAEGADSRTLSHAAGHIPGTALPGQPGNIGISGHRDTFFRPLRNIRRNDMITLTTPFGEYRYRVVSTRIVTPFNVAVLASSGDEILTLVTCYPFYFIGSAPDRFIVRAERVT